MRKPKTSATPGPFFALGRTVRVDRPGSLSQLAEIAICKSRRIGSLTISKQEAEANARLFATAPALLDIVRLVDDNVRGGEPCPVCSTAPHRADCGLVSTLREINGESA